MCLSISPARRLKEARIPYLYDVAYHSLDVAYHSLGVQLSIDLEKWSIPTRSFVNNPGN
jgi:hypothetical protein